jgi:hypothetical protein
MKRVPLSAWLQATLACAVAGLLVAAPLGCRLLTRHSPPDAITPYQKALAAPQPRVDQDGMDANRPLGILQHPPTKPVILGREPNACPVFHLTLDQVVTKALSNSPEVRIVSLDASIAEQLITKSEADFDPSVFGRLNDASTHVPKTTFS